MAYYHQAPYYNGVVAPVDDPKFFYQPVIRPNDMKLVITGAVVIYANIPQDDVSLKYRMTMSTNPHYEKCDKADIPDIDERNAFFHSSYQFTREKDDQTTGANGRGIGIGFTSGVMQDFQVFPEPIHTLTRMIVLGYESNDDTITEDLIWWWIYCHLEPLENDLELWSLQRRNWLRRRITPIAEVNIPDYQVPFRRGILVQELI